MSDDKLEFGYDKQLAEALRQVVCDRLDLVTALHAADIPESDRLKFSVAFGHVVGNLNAHNCADYGLSEKDTIAWMEDGRPGGYTPSAPEPDFSEDPGAVIP